MPLTSTVLPPWSMKTLPESLPERIDVVVQPLYPAGTGLTWLLLTLTSSFVDWPLETVNPTDAFAMPRMPTETSPDTDSEMLVSSPRVSSTLTAVLAVPETLQLYSTSPMMRGSP